MASNGPGRQFGLSWAINPNFWGGSKSFGTHISEYRLGTSFVLFVVGHGTKWGPRDENVKWHKNWCFGPKVNFLFLNRDFCQWGISPIHPRLQLSCWTNTEFPRYSSFSRAWAHLWKIARLGESFGLGITKLAPAFNFPKILIGDRRLLGSSKN